MTLDRFLTAFALLTAALIATTSLVATGYVLGVRHSTADEIARVDEIRATHAVCMDAVRMAERAGAATLAAQETFRAVYAARMEAMTTTTTTTEVDR